MPKPFGGRRCYRATDDAGCTGQAGTPGAAGSICNAAGTSSEMACTNGGGTFVPDAVCLPAQICIE